MKLDPQRSARFGTELMSIGDALAMLKAHDAEHLEAMRALRATAAP